MHYSIAMLSTNRKYQKANDFIPNTNWYFLLVWLITTDIIKIYKKLIKKIFLIIRKFSIQLKTKQKVLNKSQIYKLILTMTNLFLCLSPQVSFMCN